MREKKTDLYDFVTLSTSLLNGCCPHDCSYCLTKAFKFKEYQGEIRLDTINMRQKLPQDNAVHCEAYMDLFANDVPGHMIARIIDRCRLFPMNTYLFQTKNPGKMHAWANVFPAKSIFGVTIETNRDTSGVSSAPLPEARINAMMQAKRDYGQRMKFFLFIEPIMAFDIAVLSLWINQLVPDSVYIGADKYRTGLSEPSMNDVGQLVKSIEGVTNVRILPSLSLLDKKAGVDNMVEKSIEYGV